MRYRYAVLMLLLTCFWLMQGCARPVILVPAPSAAVVGMEAVNDVKGVRVSATGETWEGDPQVRDHVTPIEVTIQNQHGSPLRFSYSLFSLTDPSGTLYAALPPYSIKGSIQESAGFSEFSCPGFYVAPYYSPFYPYLDYYEDPFDYDPFYFDRYYACWKDIPLPTKEMLDEALPEGVLEDGAEVTGFLYFEKIKGSESYEFKMELVDAKDGNYFGTIKIPFVPKD